MNKYSYSRTKQMNELVSMKPVFFFLWIDRVFFEKKKLFKPTFSRERGLRFYLVFHRPDHLRV